MSSTSHQPNRRLPINQQQAAQIGASPTILQRLLPFNRHSLAPGSYLDPKVPKKQQKKIAKEQAGLRKNLGSIVRVTLAVLDAITTSKLALTINEWPLARGGFGAVYACANDPNSVLKITHPSQSTPAIRKEWKRSARREAHFLWKLSSHEGIVDFLDHAWIRCPSTNAVLYHCLKLERLDITLEAVLANQRQQSIDVKTFDHLAVKLSTALAWMHEHGFAHHDVKPDNIMFADYFNTNESLLSAVPKLTDLGLVKRYKDHSTHRTVAQEKDAYRAGTWMFMSPEKKFDPQYNPFLADTFALGMTLVQTLVGGGYARLNEAFKDAGQDPENLVLVTDRKAALDPAFRPHRIEGLRQMVLPTAHGQTYLATVVEHYFKD